MEKIKWIILLLCFVFAACKQDDQATNEDDFIVDTVFINGKIYTVNDSMPWAEAMWVKNGRIAAIGTNQLVQAAAGIEVETIDLKQKMVMPGIHDVHLHPIEAASENFQFTLKVDETDAEQYASDIRKGLNQNTNATWILGWGFDIYTALDATRSPLAILDDISTTKPIAIMEQTSHSVWVNSKALALVGIDSLSANPPGGVIMKDQLGQPNGLLIDNAGNTVIDLAIASIPNNESNDYDGLINYALPELAKNGITSVCDARTYWKRNHHLTWKKAEDNGELTVRANLGLWIYPTEDDPSQIRAIQSLYSNESNSFLKINQIKLYADGIVVNTTSAMHNDFKLDLFHLPTNNGINYIDQTRMENLIAALEPAGFDFHIHAIGNRGVNEALNAIENSGTMSGRHRITHIEYVSPTDYTRFNQLNVTADAQVAGDFSQPAHWHENDNLVDANLNKSIIPLKNLSQSNARITLSSDWDVSTLNPFVGMQNAVTRAPQNISLEEVIKAYTINGAYVMRQENEVGSLERGKVADFIIINQNLFDIPTSKISETKVLNTYLEGELIYQ